MKLRDEPCSRCGWRYPGFHVCPDLSKPEPIIKPKKIRKRHSSNGGRTGRGLIRGTDEWKDAIQEGMTDFRVKQREMFKPRNDAIVSHYKSGLSFKNIAEIMGINGETVVRVVHEAEAKGLLVVRRFVPDEERTNQIVKLYSSGKSMPEVAEELGIHRQAVGRALHRAQKAGQVTIRKGGRPPKKVTYGNEETEASSSS